MSVDGTDFRSQQFKPWSKTWYSHKFEGPGLCYEIGVCILSGSIVWIHGPFRCGEWPDINIFKHALITYLEQGERVQADNGYRGYPKVKTPNLGGDQRVDQRHETVNKRLKQIKCLKNIWRHDLNLHSVSLWAVAVITQLSFENGEPVFDVDYDDFDYNAMANMDNEEDDAYAAAAAAAIGTAAPNATAAPNVHNNNNRNAEEDGNKDVQMEEENKNDGDALDDNDL